LRSCTRSCTPAFQCSRSRIFASLLGPIPRCSGALDAHTAPLALASAKSMVTAGRASAEPGPGAPSAQSQSRLSDLPLDPQPEKRWSFLLESCTSAPTRLHLREYRHHVVLRVIHPHPRAPTAADLHRILSSWAGRQEIYVASAREMPRTLSTTAIVPWPASACPHPACSSCPASSTRCYQTYTGNTSAVDTSAKVGRTITSMGSRTGASHCRAALGLAQRQSA
jgi:hypothetical protein